MSQAFAELGLSADMLRTVQSLGYEQPTPIQAATIPLLLEGHDLIAQAQTGTGKTAAFSIPLVELLRPDDRRVQALVLVPTRELAVQVAEAIHQLGASLGAIVAPIYGGQPYDRQVRALRAGTPIVVATPGRLLDHIRRGTLVLDGVRAVVLDEADEMLDMGFLEDIEFLLEQLPPERQTALFSATIPRRIEDLARRHLPNARRISIEQEARTAPQTRQFYYETPYAAKFEALARILDHEAPRSAIIFCRTKREVDEVTERLDARGYVAVAIHGDIAQNQRERLLDAFRDNRADLLVATDVAARGLDIPEVSHVINYDIPLNADAYVHRIGRTGRMGRKGEAVTFVTYREIPLLRAIERQIHRKLKPLRLPTPEDISTRRREELVHTLREAIERGSGPDERSIVEQLSSEHDPLAIAAAAMHLVLEPPIPTASRRGDGLEEATVTEPRPARARSNSGRPQQRGRIRGRAER